MNGQTMGLLTEYQKIRFADALARVDGDEELLVTLAEIAADDGPHMLQQLSEELRGGDVIESGRTAHALKGLLSTYEVGPPVDALQAIVEASHSHDIDRARMIFGEISEELLDFIELVRQLSVQSGSPSRSDRADR